MTSSPKRAGRAWTLFESLHTKIDATDPIIPDQPKLAIEVEEYELRIIEYPIMTSKEDARTKDSHTNASRRGGHLEEVGISQDLKSLWDPNDKVSSSNWHPAVTVGFGLFVFVQLVPLLSLPPVLRSRGAPYLPTFQKRMEAMFRLLREEVRL